MGAIMADDGFREFLRELTEPLGGVTFRRMFGGLSIYQDGMVFALEVDGSLYFKVDGETRERFVAEECPQFEYTTKDGRTAQMPYWRAPERLYDEPDEFIDWCRAAVGVARRAEVAKAEEKTRKASRKRKAAADTD